MAKETQDTFDVKGDFNNLSEFYDAEELRFFLDSSALMVPELDLTGVKYVLDLATGTGHTVFELVSKIPDGHIIGVDISRSMLEKAELKKGNLPNVEFRQFDINSLELLDGKFDLITCSFGVYFVTDMVQFFQNVAAKLNKDGKFVLISFGEESLEPYGMVFVSDLMEMGFLRKIPPSFSAFNRKCFHDFHVAGYKNVNVIEKKMEYPIKSAEEWWKIVWGTAMRSFLVGLSPEELKKLREVHLKKISSLINENKNTYKINILITIGQKIEK